MTRYRFTKEWSDKQPAGHTLTYTNGSVHDLDAKTAEKALKAKAVVDLSKPVEMPVAPVPADEAGAAAKTKA